jgi:LacI family transcriptional regulator
LRTLRDDPEAGPSNLLTGRANFGLDIQDRPVGGSTAMTRNRLRNRLDDEAPRSGRQVRLAEVAARAEVSTSTASRVLSGRGDFTDATKDAVIRAADELGYRPSPVARSLRTRRSYTVGLVVPSVAHAFYAALLQGAQAHLHAAGYRLILMDSDGDDAAGVRAALETLLDQRVDGLLVSTTPFAAPAFAELLDGTPCVFIDEILPGAGVGSVALENAAGIAALVDHVAGEHGHERIAFLGGPSDRTDGAERLAGFEDAMAARGLAVAPELVRTLSWDTRAGFAHANAILDLDEPPTAIVAASVELALGALAAARGRRLSVPDDLAVVCFDDVDYAPLLESPLTAIAYDNAQLGADSARILVEAMQAGGDGPPERRDLRVGVRLVRRRSCGCAYDPANELPEMAR